MLTLAWIAAASAVEPGAVTPDAGFSTWRGAPVVVNVWASWCGPCRAELPLLDDLDARLGAGTQVVAMTADASPRGTALVRHLDLQLPIAFDAAAIAWLAPEALPTTYVLDAEGVVRHVHVGALDASGIARLEAELATLAIPR